MTPQEQAAELDKEIDQMVEEDMANTEEVILNRDFPKE